jgi:hypothetical protein
MVREVISFPRRRLLIFFFADESRESFLLRFFQHRRGGNPLDPETSRDFLRKIERVVIILQDKRSELTRNSLTVCWRCICSQTSGAEPP